MHVLIIGAGAAGTMAAWRLAKAGHEVTVLEQFKLDHDRGSSFGESRIVRRVYPDPLYTGLMAEAYELWDELQDSWNNCCPSGRNSDEAELINRSGGLYFGPAGNSDIEAAKVALKINGVPYVELNSQQISTKYPEFKLPANTSALFEPTMGYARASNAIKAAAFLARRSGAQIIEETVVTKIDRAVSGLTVTTNDCKTYTAERLLITAGAWTLGFLAQLGIHARMQATRQVYIHLEPVGGVDRFVAGKFPTWIDIGTKAYGFPQIGNVEGVKIAFHIMGSVTNPDSVNRGVSVEDREIILRYAASHFEGLSNNVVYEKVCLYTNTPDEEFVIDEVPNLPGAFVISACSGHGFKFAPLIGQIGADIALNAGQDRDLTRFKLSRLVANS